MCKVGKDWFQNTNIAMLTKFFNLVKSHHADIVLAIAIGLISLTSFNLGKISAYNHQKKPLTITEPVNSRQSTARAGQFDKYSIKQNTGLAEEDRGQARNILKNEKTIVGSKKSRLYHFAWCIGSFKISAKNKVVFANEAAALAAGYTLASNCNK